MLIIIMVELFTVGDPTGSHDPPSFWYRYLCMYIPRLNVKHRHNDMMYCLILDSALTTSCCGGPYGIT